jgi:hypothetical protein
LTPYDGDRCDVLVADENEHVVLVSCMASSSPTKQAVVYLVYSLVDLLEIMQMKTQIEQLQISVRASSDPRMFLFSPATISKNGNHSVASEYHKRMFKGCVFCGKEENVSMAHLVSEVLESDGIYLAMFNKPNYNTNLDVKSPRNFIRLCGSKGVNGSCHDAFDYYRLSLMYDPAEGNYIIFSVDKLSSLHLKRIALSVEYPPYKRLLCWRFRMSISTFSCAYDHLPELADVADYSEAGSTLGAGESTEESASSTLGVEEGSTKY